ncbi:MAG: C4-dicarboxylate ABC transporter [Lachnospiraceae bacterium]|nr:C4-dicarboxylate ABC transporter [Lachnospiraceae bacterium]
MLLKVISLAFLIAAIGLGFAKKLNVGLVSLGLALILSMIGGIKTSVIFSGFPNKLFLTLLGTMFFFSLLQENHTLELLSKKLVSLVGKRTYLIPILLYVVSYVMSAAGPGAISVQSVMIIFAVSLSVQMNANPLLLAGMAYLGAVGGTSSPIALTGIIVSDLASEAGMLHNPTQVFIGVSAANLMLAVALYIIFKGYKLKATDKNLETGIIQFNFQQKVGTLSLIALVVLVVGFQFDVGLTAFSLSLLLILFGIGNEKAAIKMVPWNVMILICGVNVLMAVTKQMGGIELLSDLLSSMMNQTTASPLMAMTAGIMSWFSSANGVVFPTLIPTLPDIVSKVGGNTSVMEMTMAIIAGATATGISPFSTGGSLLLASYSQETKASEKEQQSIFLKLIILSAASVLGVIIFAFVGGFRIFG